VKRAERALRDTEEQLRQSQKMEAIGALAGSIAHDFNNLLSVILGYTETLLGEIRSGDPMREDLTQIARAGERAAELTRRLLAFSRRQVMNPRVVELGDSVSSMARMLERIIGEDVERRPEIKVLFMTGYTDDAVMRHGVLGAEMALVAKPLMPQPLLSKLREVLDAKG
jgi:signal transduction histidine kinase